MSKARTSRSSALSLALRKFVVSAAVILTFAAYILHQQFVTPTPTQVAPPSPTSSTSNLLLASQQQSTTVPSSPVPLSQQIAPTSAPFVPTQTLYIPSATLFIPTATPFVPTATPFVPTDTPFVPTATNQGLYRDGTYSGPEEDAYYGLVQVQITVQNGQVANVQFLDYPHDRRTSQQINAIAMPYLIQETIQAQSAQVDVISGATLTSEGFIQSLTDAISQARNS